MCRITSGTGAACQFSTGGNLRVWLANSADIESWADTSSPPDGILDSVTFTGELAIDDVTNANPAVVTTASPHGLSAGDVVAIVGTSPMTGLVATHTVGNTPSSTEFELEGYDSTSLAAFGASSVRVLPSAFYEFVVQEESLSQLSEQQRTATSNFMNQTVTFNLTGGANNQAGTDLMDALGTTPAVVAIVESKGGFFTIYGYTSGLKASVNFNVGAANTDAAGFSITLTGPELGNPKFFDAGLSRVNIPVIG